MKRIFHPYTRWEDATLGMWRHVSGDERIRLLDIAERFMKDTRAFGRAMIRVTREMPYACEVNLSTRSFNRQAWIGHAACVLVTTSPEDVTRESWWRLTLRQQDAANHAADVAIAQWEKRWKKGEGRTNGNKNNSNQAGTTIHRIRRGSMGA